MTEKRSTIEQMIQEISKAEEVYRPSLFWEMLGGLNREQLERRGYLEFKRTVNQNYFNWLPSKSVDNQFQNLWCFWRKNKTLWPFLLRFKNPKNLEAFTEKKLLSSISSRWRYKLFVGMLWEFARKNDPERLLDKLEEPRLGSPLDIRRGFRRISQDLANSVLERNDIMKFLRFSGAEAATVAELGAGYGRLAYVFLKTTPCRYFIFDIPPALDISQWYLSSLFPNRRIFRFRHFDSYQEIREELEGCDLAFFTPNQLDMFPDDAVDVFLTISSLPEMRMDQIRNYMTLMQRISKEFLFVKQWYVGINTADNIIVRREDYSLSNDWNIIEERRDPVQDLFFIFLAKKKQAARTSATTTMEIANG